MLVKLASEPRGLLYLFCYKEWEQNPVKRSHDKRAEESTWMRTVNRFDVDLIINLNY